MRSSRYGGDYSAFQRIPSASGVWNSLMVPFLMLSVTLLILARTGSNGAQGCYWRDVQIHKNKLNHSTHDLNKKCVPLKQVGRF